MNSQNPFLKYQFWIAAAFGVLAFALNLMTAEKQPELTNYLVLARDVSPGETIKETDFRVQAMLPAHMPDQVFRADDMDQLKNSYFRYRERSGAVVLQGLVVRQSSSYSLPLRSGETPVRIPLPSHMNPTDFVVGTTVNIKLHQNGSGDAIDSLEASNYRIISIGTSTEKLDKDEERAADVRGQNFIRIAVPVSDSARAILESASEVDGAYRVVDIFQRKS